jgi:hypothetical protein
MCLCVCVCARARHACHGMFAGEHMWEHVIGDNNTKTRHAMPLQNDSNNIIHPHPYLALHVDIMREHVCTDGQHAAEPLGGEAPSPARQACDFVGFGLWGVPIRLAGSRHSRSEDHKDDPWKAHFHCGF